MTLRGGTLYRCHLFSYGGPQTLGVRSRWTSDLVPIEGAEILSGTELELLVEIDESAGLTLGPDLKVRFDILEQDYLLTGGLDDVVISLLGTGATQPDADFRTEGRETIFYELGELDDTVAWIRRFAADHVATYRSTLLVLEQPAGEGFNYTIATWWTAERLEDYANSELYFIVNVNDTFDDQADTIDVSPNRWNPQASDPGIWVPFVAGRHIHELLTTSITDWHVTADEAREAFEMLTRLRPEDLLRVTSIMRHNRTWYTLEEKLRESDPILYTQFSAMELMLDPNLGYLVYGDQIGVLISHGSRAIPEYGGFLRADYDKFIEQNPGAADSIRRSAIDGAQYGDRFANRVFVNPTSLSEQAVEALGVVKFAELTRANIPSDKLDAHGHIHQIPGLGPIGLGGYAPKEAANVIARHLFGDGESGILSPNVRLYILSRGAPYTLQSGRIGTGNRMPVFQSTFVPDPNLPAVKRAHKLSKYHTYLGPVRDTTPQILSAVLWYYNWMSQHIDEPIFFEKNPEDLFAEALGVAFRPLPQSPLEPYLRFTRLMDEREKTASVEEKSRILRSSLAYWAWIDAHPDDATLLANDPGKVWATGYTRAVIEDTEKEIQRKHEELIEQRRQLDLPLIDRKLEEAIEFVTLNVYVAREPYVVEGVEEDEGFLGLFAEKRGVGYLVMPSETEKELRSAIGGAYLDDIFSRMIEPGFKDVDILHDFQTWLADRPQMGNALSSAMSYPYTEKYSFEVDLPAWQTAIEIGIGFVPIVILIVGGPAIAVAVAAVAVGAIGAGEVITGTSMFGRPLGTLERGITAAAILLPAAAKLTRVGGGLIRASAIVDTYGLTGRDAQAVYRSCLPIAEGTAGNSLLREAFEDVKAGRLITDPVRIRALEDLIKQMKLTDRATARALTLPPAPELAGAALAKEDTAITLIKGVFGEQTGAYRTLDTESRTAVRAAIRNESALFRRALVAETAEGHARNVEELLKQMELYGMTADQQRVLRQALEGLNLERRTVLNEAVRTLSRERIVAVGEAGRVTRQSGLMNTRYSDRISKLHDLRLAATDGAVRRRLGAKISRLQREQRRLQAWINRGNFDLQDFQRMIADEPGLRRLVESGGDDMLLQHWINFKARPSGRAVVSAFPGYVERMQGQFVGQFGEFEVAFRISHDWILIKVPDDMVTIPGTDLIAISRRGGPVRFIDNKAFATSEVEAVDALTRNFTRNAVTDLEELGRIAGDLDLPTHFRLAQNRITRANTAIQARIQGLTPDEIASPDVQRDIAKILQQETIERVVTNAGGKVTDISQDLREMGIDLWDLN